MIEPRATETLTIGRLAGRAGVGVETIRYYEKQRLIPKPARTRSGYRQYPAGEVARVRFIRRAQQLGFSLREIGELLALRVDASADCVAVRHSAERKIESIAARIADLRAMQAALESLRDSCAAQAPGAECAILEALAREEDV